MAEIQKFTHEDWLAEADRRFGTDAKDWKFVCPRCETVQSIRDFLEAEVPKETIDGVIGFSCIGLIVDKIDLSPLILIEPIMLLS